jgi:hypothetical protein
MQIDRTRFLLLTGALTAAALGASQGCTQKTNVVPDGGAAAPADTDAADAASDDVVTDDARTDGSSDGGACLGDTPAEARACTDLGGLDDAGMPLDASSDGGETCIQSLSGQSACENQKLLMKGAVAREAIACLLTLPTCEGVTPEATRCAMDALKKACPDPAAKALCQQILAACGDAGADAGVTEAECEAFANGLSREGRDRLLTCTTEGGACFNDVASCISYMF